MEALWFDYLQEQEAFAVIKMSRPALPPV